MSVWRRLNNSRYLHFADQVHLLNFVYVLIQNENSSMCLTFDNDIHQTEKQQSGGLWTVAAHFKIFFFFCRPISSTAYHEHKEESKVLANTMTHSRFCPFIVVKTKQDFSISPSAWHLVYAICGLSLIPVVKA